MVNSNPRWSSVTQRIATRPHNIYHGLLFARPSSSLAWCWSVELRGFIRVLSRAASLDKSMQQTTNHHHNHNQHAMRCAGTVNASNARVSQFVNLRLFACGSRRTSLNERVPRLFTFAPAQSQLQCMPTTQLWGIKHDKISMIVVFVQGNETIWCPESPRNRTTVTGIGKLNL